MVGGFPRVRLRFFARLPTRNWSSYLMILVRLIRSGLRLCFSGFLRSSIQRSISFSCEKQTSRLDHLPCLGLSCGSLLTGRWFVRFPSDDPYMTLYSESHLVEKPKLSTGGPLSGGKLLLIWWIIKNFGFDRDLRNYVRWSGPALGRGWRRDRTFGPIPALRLEEKTAGIETFCLRPEPL
jgi:hypothetical protein